jgi:hypothetical protein
MSLKRRRRRRSSRRRGRARREGKERRAAKVLLQSSQPAVVLSQRLLVVVQRVRTRRASMGRMGRHVVHQLLLLARDPMQQEVRRRPAMLMEARSARRAAVALLAGMNHQTMSTCPHSSRNDNQNQLLNEANMLLFFVTVTHLGTLLACLIMSCPLETMYSVDYSHLFHWRFQ